MTKSQRAKKAQTADFQKAKIKVGKKKLAPLNSTDVSFKSKALVIPGQSSLEDKGDVTNSRKLTLKDLLGQLKHYSPNVRKDALYGIADLLKRHPTALTGHLGLVMEGVLPLAVDEAPPVRQALRSLLEIFGKDFPATVMSPFMRLFQVYATAAMTHIFEDIRLSSLDLVDTWTAAYPQSATVMRKQLMPLYVSLLTNISSADASRKSDGSAAPKPTAGRLLSAPSSRLSLTESRGRILLSLYAFLDLVLHSHRDSFWFASIDDAQLAGEQAGSGGIGSAPLDLHAGDAEADQQAATLSSFDLHAAGDMQLFMGTVLPVLMECWMEHAAATFPSTEINDLTKLAILNPVLRTMNLLWRQYSLIQATPDYKFVGQFVRDLERHVSQYFPFGQGSYLITNPKAQVMLESMSFEYCELASHLLVCGAPASFGTSMLRACTFATKLLQDWPPGSSAETLERLLPLIWRHALQCTPSSKDLLSAFEKFYLSVSPRSPTAKTAARFYVALITHRRKGSQLLHDAADLQPFWRTFVGSIPRTLWELRNTDVDFSDRLLGCLSQMLRTSSGGDIVDVAATQAALVPFFFKQVRAGGRPQPVRVFGPFATLPAATRSRALDLLFYLRPLQPKLLSALLVALSSGAVDADTVRYALQVVRLCETAGDGADTFLSFYASILFGVSAADAAVEQQAAAPAAQNVSGVLLFHASDVIKTRRVLMSNLLDKNEPLTHATFVQRRIGIIRAALDCLASTSLASPADVLAQLEPLADELLAAACAPDLLLAVLMLLADRRLAPATAMPLGAQAGRLALALVCHVALPAEAADGGQVVMDEVMALMAARPEVLVQCLAEAASQLGESAKDEERQQRICTGTYEILRDRTNCLEMERHAGTVQAFASAVQECGGEAARHLNAHLKFTFGRLASW